MTITVERVTIHCVARCNVCGWFDDNYKVAELNAIKHCKETGHSVEVDIGEIITKTTVEAALGLE